jgi:hypothetical protein
MENDIPIELQADLILAAREAGSLRVTEDRIKGHFTIEGGELII